jgi:hypothetical protein
MGFRFCALRRRATNCVESMENSAIAGKKGNCGQAGGKAERLKVRQICGLPPFLTDLERADEQ